MNDQGIHALFVPLERLVEDELTKALTPDNMNLFFEWIKDESQITFFLDSVDEAKIRRQQDFERAINNFFHGIQPFKKLQTRLVISSRISEWQWHKDRNILLQYMNVQIKAKENKENTPPELRIVQIQPLDRSRVHKFAIETGMQNPESFIEALSSHHAWEFARRPIDVADLILYWNENVKLGTLTELIEFDLKNKLKETPERSKNDLLTPEQVRIGTECLAAAVLFCKHFSILIPDTVPPENINGAIDSSDCLPSNWTPAMCQAILTRPIFDSASYGQIRFHHRRITEYLAASWLKKRMIEGCPYPTLEELLFDQQGERRFISSSLRPVIAWLALGNEYWNQRIRDRILSCAPDLFLTHGDPEALSSDYKQALLQSLIDMYGGRKRVYLKIEAEALNRLGDPELAPYISSKIRDTNTPYEIRIILLQLVRYGKLQKCLNSALDICASPNESDEIKNYAVAAIRDLGNLEVRRNLENIFHDIKIIDYRLCALLCAALFPEVIGPDGLADLLRKAIKIRRSVLDLKWILKDHLETKLSHCQTADLLRELLKLAQEEPRIHDNQKILPLSEQFIWLGEIISLVLLNLIKQQSLESYDIDLAAKAFWLLGYFQVYDQLERKIIEELNSLLKFHPTIRRAYVWINIEEMHHNKPYSEPHLPLAFNFDIVRPCKVDIDWLVRDILKGTSQEIKVVSLKLSIELWRYLGFNRSIKTKIRKSIKSFPFLKRLFKKETSFTLFIKLKRLLFGNIYSLSFSDILKRIHHRFITHFPNLRYKLWLWCNLSKLRDGTLVHVLSDLAFAADETYDGLGAKSWKPLISKWGTSIALAAAAGWKATWRKFEPLLPYQKPNPNQTDLRIIVGLSGINISLDEGELKFSRISTNDAKRACLYAVNEFSGFTYWLPELAQYHPGVVQEVLSECIRGEWQIKASSEPVHGVITSLCYDTTGLTSLVGEVILKELQAGDPKHYDILKAALTILLNLPDPPYSDLSSLAMNRTITVSNEDRYSTLWMIVWLQLNAKPAIQKLEMGLPGASDPTSLMVYICAELSAKSHSAFPLIKNPNYIEAECLQKLIPLVYRYIRVEVDTDHSSGEGYSPTPRDDAQDFRNGLLGLLARNPGIEADNILRSFIENPLFEKNRDYLLYLVEQHAELLAESRPWHPLDIRIFMESYEIPPRSDSELFKIACRRFIEIKDEVERGDISSRSDLHPEDLEDQFRSWLARQLRSLSREQQYNVIQEEEIDLKQRPDLRIEAPGLGPVSVEIKWADNWTMQKLEDGLNDQLVGQYLRAPDSNFGIYVLGKKAKNQKTNKSVPLWTDNKSGRKFTFDELVEYFEKAAENILEQRRDVYGLKVFGINFEKPS